MERIQRKRTKGFNLQEYSKSLNGLECVIVSRPSKWGNPFLVSELGAKEAVLRYRECLLNNVMVYRWIDEIQASIEYDRFKWMSENIKTLRGKNLACFCSLVNKKGEYTPCHADILLELCQ